MSIPAAVRAEYTGDGTVEVGSQIRCRGRSRVGPHDDQRTGRQYGDPLTSEVAQLPLDPIPEDGVTDCLGYDEAHSGRCLGSGTTQVDDERSATGSTSSAHSGSEVTAVAHSVSG